LADGIAVRALSLLGLVMVAAGALITLLWDSGDKAVRRGIELTIYAGAAVVLIATALNFETIHNTYANSSYSDLVFRTPSGGYWLTRIGLVLLITVSASFLHEAPRRTGAALMGCVVIYLWAYTSTSHAAAGLGSSWAKGLDIAHASAAVTWIGAVVGLAIASRLGNARDRWSELLPRFSLLASCMVFIVLTSGVMSAFIEMDTVSKLWRTRYGITLLIKVAVMLPLLLVAGYNARWGKGLLTKGNEAARRRFVLFAFAELALGLAVFGFAAALTQTTVSKSVILQKDVKPFDQTLPFGDLQIHLAIDPNRTGLNTYKVTLEKNNAAVAAERVRLTFRYQDDASVGASTLTLTENQGTYVGQGPFMTLEGRWRVETEVRRADVDDVVGFFDVRPAGTPVVGNLSGGPWSNPAPGLTWNQFGGLIFLLAGFGFALSRTPLRRAGKQAGWVGSGATMAGFAFGILHLFGVHNHAVVTGLPTNPFVNDRDSIATGQKLYAQNCAACHGQSGVPPKGLDLNPYPLDLTVHVPQHPDGQLYEFISKGIPGTAMAAWGDGRLTTEQIWHLVNYLRTLTPVDR
jgi:copper transport protein